VIAQPRLNQLSLGILTWERPANLRRTLRSYQASGLIQSVGEVLLFVNGADPKEIALGQKFGLRLISSPDNIGIGPAYAKLAEAAANPYFMFLENDWVCIEPQSVVERRLRQGMQLVQDGQAQAVRYRHRVKYGHPLYSRARCEGHELEPANRPHLLDAVHWHENPEVAFSDDVTRRTIDGENWFFTSAAAAAYTNNPCLYCTDFAQTEIAPRSIVPGIASEALLQDWWRSQPYTIAQGEGLFKHHDPGKEWRRAGSILRRWVGSNRQRRSG
jgi:hypothetical protein